MEFVVIALASFSASLLTFFSGFGLGTLLMPVFALFFPVSLAVALTAIVHFSNNLFKLALIGKNVDRAVLLRFGIPAVIASFLGAEALLQLAGLPSLAKYELFGVEYAVLPVKLLVAVLMLVFSALEVVPGLKTLTFDRRFLVVGGMLSGFFGGLSGHQGALRSAFLIRSGLTRESFIATGVSLAVLVDIARLLVYSERMFDTAILEVNQAYLTIAVLSAFGGALLGRKVLQKVEMPAIQNLVAVLLAFIAVGLGAGLI